MLKDGRGGELSLFWFVGSGWFWESWYRKEGLLGGVDGPSCHTGARKQEQNVVFQKPSTIKTKCRVHIIEDYLIIRNEVLICATRRGWTLEKCQVEGATQRTTYCMTLYDSILWNVGLTGKFIEMKSSWAGWAGGGRCQLMEQAFFPGHMPKTLALSLCISTLENVNFILLKL